MGIFSKLFGSGTPARPARDVTALAAHLAKPALQLLPGLPVRGTAPVNSWFLGGADPQFGAAPVYRGRALNHLVTLDLAEAQARQAMAWLPGQGSLAFFYDLKEQPAGAPEHRGAWSVAFRAERATSRSADSRPIRFKNVRTYPSSERPEVEALELNDEESDLYADLGNAQTDEEYFHQLGGHPSLIQSDTLELESQFAINGLALTQNSEKSQRGQALAASAGEWRLLLQVASDESLDLMWGDAGALYFMIRERDARAGKFDEVWLISQCF